MADKLLSIQEKGNKIYSHIRKMWLIKTPEEIVRQNYLLVLVNEYGYLLDQMTNPAKISNLRVTFGATLVF